MYQVYNLSVCLSCIARVLKINFNEFIYKYSIRLLRIDWLTVRLLLPHRTDHIFMENSK